MEIKVLKRYTLEDQRELGEYGYTTFEKYKVKKEETACKTTITVELVHLEEAYVKEYEKDAADFDKYEQILSYGFSLGAFANNELLGVAICEPYYWNNTLFIWNFHVSGRHRRTGVGRRLMQAVEELARREGFRVIGLETQNTNVPAVQFYKSCGYELGGIDLSYYTNDDVENGEVAITMKKKLDRT
ncbi:GNAT family N-acetyltransferase [Paenibacillus sp. CAA11]|uniref:GNAT family N-acetyltransferase n=1 Tax=Paenibacillus sp. CAA11 TaxID=1532905 RepID=UPI000D3340E7|nr:GNAT family N-acetyltransferase [Paenibacillus sp. CAA11]AWB42995.1 GNAT family N-acetyltransferase [Paenibacillus sp. CAA11]